MFEGEIVRALGTMSGTSLDGVDAAVIETDGVTIHGLGSTAYRAYTPQDQAILKAHLGKWQTDDVSVVEAVVEDAHVAVMSGFAGIALAGFHGQTLAHDPGGRGTHQCGDGARVAARLGVAVAWDFRTADVVAGGQGAPLAPFYHFALAKWMKADAPVVFLNLGGVGNITWVDPSCDDPADPKALLAFDTGPANAPMNDLLMQCRGLSYDLDGALAALGTADQQIVDDFLLHPYFARPAPKSLDRDAFAGLSDAVTALSEVDALATLAKAVTASVAKAMTLCPAPPAKLFVTGGGRHNNTLMTGLAEVLDCPVAPVEDAGLDGDMIEAQAFGYLAVRAARGLPLSSPQTTGIAAPITGGRISGNFKIGG
ncbi:anhydro-N-acetylmuramic acid kinase [Loktanella sp. Alg231-35]|uniref:anhydro-N-acetylmuramic acid kinase n=1 Tax=Loktanella sp. Alg231-35 TaxID=1922220 RepID=UPI000D55BDE2|nr:anhydro-N-acetylmuramic acid kinase [Loktanella sp. Alg231-35]